MLTSSRVCFLYIPERLLRLSVLSSGSSGNASYVESAEGRGLLVDAGFSYKRMKTLLARIGRRLEDVEAILLTHGHADHTSGVRSLRRERNVAVYAAPGIWNQPGAILVEAGRAFPVCGMDVTFFEVPHDSPTCGVRISDGEGDLALAIDLGEVTPEVLEWMRGAETVVLEANHDPDWLRTGPYSARLKRRISSPSGHLSNREAALAALALAPHGLKDLVLAHLSRTNNSPARACGTVSQTLREAGYGGIRVRAAKAGHPTPWVETGVPLARVENVYRYERITGAERLFEVE